jgi:hypothetical protein
MKLIGTMTGNTKRNTVRTRQDEHRLDNGISLHFTFAGSEALKRKRKLPANVPSLAAPLTMMNARPNTTVLVPCTKQLLPKVDEKKPQEPSPVDFLRSLLYGSNKAEAHKVSMHHRIFFTKPSEEEMAAYDLEVVNAIRSKDVSRLRTLRDEGKSFNACNRFGESLLHMACRRGDLGVITFLVEEVGVRLDVRDDYGRTALHDACWTASPNKDVMEVLMQVFPSESLLAEDVRGHTPFDYARKEHWADWIVFLQERKDLILKKRGQGA